MTQDPSDIPEIKDSTTQGDTGFPKEEAGDIPPNTQGDKGYADSEAEELRKEIASLREQLARSQADYNNLVRRSREELSQIGEWSENKTILKFLTILDNLERAIEHTPQEFMSHAWTTGFVSIVRSMQKVISDLGVSRMNCVGQEVNTELHEVISQAPSQDTLIQTEVETGYMRRDKALRHAKVIVGSGELPN